jgi:hypothetical protein
LLYEGGIKSERQASAVVEDLKLIEKDNSRNELQVENLIKVGRVLLPGTPGQWSTEPLRTSILLSLLPKKVFKQSLERRLHSPRALPLSRL